MSKKFKEISSSSEDELKKKLIELKRELLKMNAQVATGTIPKNPSSIRNTRRMIARIIMLMERKKFEKRIVVKKTEATKA